MREVEIYTLPNEIIRKHHIATSSWQKVRLRNLENEIERYKGDAGLEQIAMSLGIQKPTKKKLISSEVKH